MTNRPTSTCLHRTLPQRGLSSWTVYMTSAVGVRQGGCSSTVRKRNWFGSAQDTHFRLRCRYQLMDDRQQIETQHGHDQAPLDWVVTQPVPIPGPGSSCATGCRHCHSTRPGPAARSHHLCWFKSWPSCVHCQCDVLLFITSASTSTSFTRHLSCQRRLSMLL